MNDKDKERESIFCQDCGKTLMQSKGEYDHGCLDCAGSIQSEKLFWLRKENKKLQAENKKLREALEWYANRNNWKFQSYSSDCKDVIDFNDIGCRSYTDEADFACSSGGRRAREALKEIKEN